MLSSVLRSERAIAVNVLVMRAFVRHRYSLAESIELRRRLDALERELAEHGAAIDEILTALASLAEPRATDSRPIGFRTRG